MDPLKRLTLILVCGALMTTFFQSTAEARHRSGPCDTHWHHAYYSGGSTWGVRQIVRCAARRWNVDVPTALRVAACESGFRPDAYGSGNAGVYQHRLPYWPDRAAHYLRRRWHIRPNVYGARANILVTMRMVRSGGWSPWSCY